jgi:SAM-dependent methyltransferase
LLVRFEEGDAEALPYPDASFDAVLSCVGVMFAPDQEQTASELLRVCQAGGTIALANWTPDSFVGGMFRTMSKYVPPPAGLKPPGLWGTEDRIRELLGDGTTSLSMRRRTYTFRFVSAGELVEFFERNYGPTVSAFAALDPAAQQALRGDLAGLVLDHNRLDSGTPVAIPSDYLEVVAVRR